MKRTKLNKSFNNFFEIIISKGLVSPSIGILFR